MPYPVSSSWWDGAAPPSPAYSGTAIPTIWSALVVRRFYDSTVLGEIANTDYTGEIRMMGDKVIINTVPSLTIRDYVAGQSLVAEHPSAPTVELHIDKGKYFYATLDDVHLRQSMIDFLSMWADVAAQQMAIAIDTQVLASLPASVLPANSGNTAGAKSGNVRLGAAGSPLKVLRTYGTSMAADEVEVIHLITRLGQVLDEQNIPSEGRFLVIPPWFAAMIKRSDLRDASLSGDSQSIVRNGRLGRIDRFTLYSSNLLPTGTEGTLKSYYIFAGTKDALTFATQMQVTETMRSQTSFGTIFRGMQIYGFSVVNPVALASAYVVQPASEA